MNEHKPHTLRKQSHTHTHTKTLQIYGNRIMQQSSFCENSIFTFSQRFLVNLLACLWLCVCVCHGVPVAVFLLFPSLVIHSWIFFLLRNAKVRKRKWKIDWRLWSKYAHRKEQRVTKRMKERYYDWLWRKVYVMHWTICSAKKWIWFSWIEWRIRFCRFNSIFRFPQWH